MTDLLTKHAKTSIEEQYTMVKAYMQDLGFLKTLEEKITNLWNTYTIEDFLQALTKTAASKAPLGRNIATILTEKVLAKRVKQDVVAKRLIEKIAITGYYYTKMYDALTKLDTEYERLKTIPTENSQKVYSMREAWYVTENAINFRQAHKQIEEDLQIMEDWVKGVRMVYEEMKEERNKLGKDLEAWEVKINE